MVPTSPVNYSTLQGLSQDFISTEAKGKLEVWGGAPADSGGERLVRGQGRSPLKLKAFQ